MRNKEYIEACELISKVKHGSIKVKAGAIVTGSLFDWCSSTDDPEGRGYITLMTADGHATDVYSDEFSELIEPRTNAVS